MEMLARGRDSETPHAGEVETQKGSMAYNTSRAGGLKGSLQGDKSRPLVQRSCPAIQIGRKELCLIISYGQGL